MHEQRELITVREAADRCGISTTTVLRLIYNGELNAINVSAGTLSRRWRIDAHDVDALLTARQRRTSA